MSTQNSPRRRLTRVAAVLLPAAMLAGCASASDTPGDATTVTVWSGLPYDTFTAANTANFERCEESTGITAEISDFPPEELTTKVLQAATSNSLPDLLYLEGTDLARVAETGMLTPLSDYDITADGYAPALVEMGSIDGELYGLAPGFNTVGVVYDIDAFAEAGVEIPQTFAELRAAAQELTTPDRMGIALAAGGGAGSYVFLPFLLSAGGHPADIDSPEAAEALQLWSDFIVDGSTSKSAVTWEWDAQDYFREGEAAMVLSGPWLVQEAAALDKNIGAFAVPGPDSADQARSPIGAELWTIPVTGDATQQAAAELLACITDEENSVQMARESGRLPGLTSAAEVIAEESPSLAPFIRLAQTAYLRDPETTGKESERLTTAIQDALANGTAPAAALAAAQKQ